MAVRILCSACHGKLEPFLDLGTSPVADAYTDTAEESYNSPRFPLWVGRCEKCGLVQQLQMLSGDRLFGNGYAFRSSASAPLRDYHARYAASIKALHGPQLERGLVEIGCNDGDLLRHFYGLGAVGVDPSAAAREAADAGLPVIVEPFGLDVAKRIRDDFGPRGVVVANHVLAHVENVSDTLAGIAHLMDEHSVAVVEVQYLPDLLVNNAFDLVYHEHRNFFSLTSLEAAAHRHGLFAIDAELTDRQGGSLRVTLAKVFQATRETDRTVRLRHSEMWLDSFGAFEGMQGRAERIRTRLWDILAEQKGVTAVYGAPAKATTLLNYCGLTAVNLPWCVDTTAGKQGRFIPGTGIPIVSEAFDEKERTYLLAAWNYAGDIIRNNPGNRWIVPFPAPVIL